MKTVRSQPDYSTQFDHEEPTRLVAGGYPLDRHDLCNKDCDTARELA
ncbi:hypothetical protein QCD71_25100 [Sphingomonas sp. PsM26]|nr:hypothetical protein [Sphingomonas sp. PsM26]